MKARFSTRLITKIKGIFWRNNIRGFAPFLSTQVTLGTGTTARNVELIGTYFDKQLRYGKDDFTAGVMKTTPGGMCKVNGRKMTSTPCWSEHVSLMQWTSSAAMVWWSTVNSSASLGS